MKMYKNALLLWIVVSLGMLIAGGCGTVVPQPILLEAEDGIGDGELKIRSAASNERSVWLRTDETLAIQFELADSARYKLDIIASNDHVNDVPLEIVQVRLDDEEIGSFSPADTGNGGYGWNKFVTNYCLAPVEISAGDHSLAFTVTDGDGFGVEIDAVILTRSE